MKEFEGDTRVIATLVSQGETRESLEEYWRNLYLRGQMAFDPTGHIGKDLYKQEMMSTPAGTAFVIDVDQRIALPLYGYNPQLVIDTIRGLLGDDAVCDGDVNGDATVDPLDAGYVLARLGCSVGTGDEDCDAADANGDGLTDPIDVGFVLARFGGCT